jgi:hypothetical protein
LFVNNFANLSTLEGFMGLRGPNAFPLSARYEKPKMTCTECRAVVDVESAAVVEFCPRHELAFTRRSKGSGVAERLDRVEFELREIHALLKAAVQDQ